MDIKDIPKLSLEILKHNIPNYIELSNDQILEYFKYGYDIFSLPKLPDEEKGLAILKDTITQNELIVIAGDYDCDGLSGAAIGYKALKYKSNNYKVIHNKRINGNGFTESFMETIIAIHKETPISLLISVDHGSNDIRSVDEMHAIGIKNVIITDHHSITDQGTVNADAFINPQRDDNTLKGMCGAHVLFKLLSGLYIDNNGEMDKDIFNTLYKPCLPYVALATIADVVPLNYDYNRRAVRGGVMLMNASDGLWSILIDRLGIPGLIMYKDLGFKLGPFINTGNRSNNEELFYKILVEEDAVKLAELITDGCKLNMSRKKVRSNAMKELSISYKPEPEDHSACLIIDVPMAINGVIAGNVGEMYKVPAVCFSHVKDKNILVGSARATLKHISIVDVFKTMSNIDSELFIGCGGHAGAGGCSIPFNKFDRFKELFNKVVSEIPKPDKIEDGLYIIDFNTKHLNYGIVEEIDYTGPYGNYWPSPLLRGNFRVEAVYTYTSMAIILLRALNGNFFKCTYFYKTNSSELTIDKGDVIIVVFEPQYYKRNNNVNFTLLIDHIEDT